MRLTRPDWKVPFTFMTRDPDWKKKVLLGGLWLILFPIGWLVALGYRKAAIFALLESPEPLLPEWRGRWGRYLLDGMRASAVILLYFSAFVLAFWLLALDSPDVAIAHRAEIALFGLGVVACPPLGLPFLPLYYAARYSWVEVAAPEAVALGVLFVSTTFLMPGAFLQVSLHGRFRAAFRLDRVLTFVTRNAGAYVASWVVSLAATAAAGALGPAVFWGIFWSYLVIVYVFNEALFHSETEGVRERFQHSSIRALSVGQSRRGGIGDE